MFVEEPANFLLCTQVGNIGEVQAKAAELAAMAVK